MPERCEGCGLVMVDDPGFPGALICPSCDDELLATHADPNLQTEGYFGNGLYNLNRT